MNTFKVTIHHAGEEPGSDYISIDAESLAEAIKQAMDYAIKHEWEVRSVEAEEQY